MCAPIDSGLPIALRLPVPQRRRTKKAQNRIRILRNLVIELKYRSRLETTALLSSVKLTSYAEGNLSAPANDCMRREGSWDGRLETRTRNQVGISVRDLRSSFGVHGHGSVAGLSGLPLSRSIASGLHRRDVTHQLTSPSPETNTTPIMAKIGIRGRAPQARCSPRR
jgi:hypothetical protein